eukprot:TRINITY_DN8195_c0_g1_i1.p1 TRINITY_DN8195_c0_g1~~TRINITY_DN8195_c0_g1_i1.p1  ORF type:complete len:486 (+),score=148.48 TRINITY_DN8195_c0_g1_i1:41-1498(+)
MENTVIQEENIVKLDSLKSWQDMSEENTLNGINIPNPKITINENINKKIFLWKGDICTLDVDAIVNSTNETFNEKTGISARIMSLAGGELKQELKQLESCRTGEAKITSGYSLPSRYIIHTVGPRYNVKYVNAAENALHSCYRSCLQVLKEQHLKSIAFCVINSPTRGYPMEGGAHVALRTVRRVLEHYEGDFSNIIFTIDNDSEFEIYSNILPLYFPRNPTELELSNKNLPESIGNEWGEHIIEERVIRISTFPGSNDEENPVESSSWLDSEEINPSLTIMQDDLDEKRVQRIKSSQEIEAEKTELLYQSYLERARKTDLSFFSNLNIVSVTGRDSSDRPIITVCMCKLPETGVDMEKFLLYLIKVMDPMVNSKYNLVYYHSNMSSKNKPEFSWLKNVYNIFSVKYSNNLHLLFIVHPTFWLKLVVNFIKTFSSTSFLTKLRYYNSLQELFEHLPKNQLKIEKEVLEYDKIENGTLYESTSDHL